LNKELSDNLLGLGNNYTGGMISPDCKSFYVNIPKNASSFINPWLWENDWEFSKGNDQISEVLIVLRDPVERFISGFTQYIQGNILFTTFDYGAPTLTIEKLNEYWPMVERFMGDQVVWFDDHTWFQNYYVKDVFPNIPRRYFWIDDQLNNNLKQAYNLNDPANADINASRGIGLEIKQLIRNSLRNPVILAQVKRILQPDYDLISQAGLTK